MSTCFVMKTNETTDPPPSQMNHYQPALNSRQVGILKMVLTSSITVEVAVAVKPMMGVLGN